MNQISCDPQVVSMRCLMANPGASFDWHSHAFEEFSLVTDDETVIGYPSGKRLTQKNTLLMYRAGERHGAWCLRRQAPRFWVVHFTAGAQLYRQMDRLSAENPSERVWQLTSEQARTFRWIFLQMLTERTQHRIQSLLAESAWLRLLLVSVQRWAHGETVADLAPDGISPEVTRLWYLVNASVGKPEEFMKQIHR
jgi:hypothetical protein